MVHPKVQASSSSTSASLAPLPHSAKVLLLCVSRPLLLSSRASRVHAAALSKMLLLYVVVRSRANVGSAGSKAGSLGRSDGPTTAKDPTRRQKVVWDESPALGWGQHGII